MTTATPLTAGITLLIVLLMFGTVVLVGQSRHRYGVHAPHMTGHPLFERAYRVQMNTVEWAVMTLPCLWIFAAFLSDVGAAAVGAVWLVGRIWYAIGYQRSPALRGPGFTIGALAFGAAGLGAGYGVAAQLFRGVL